jgi:DNA-binding LacI/PurR family transcriptional regulator
MKITIKDVANEAGVSIATVSRVLNNKDRVKSSTRKKIEDAIVKLDFKPDQIARTMINKETKTIGLLVPNLKNEFWAGVATAIQDELWKEGFTTLLCATTGFEDSAEREGAFIKNFIQRRVDGVIYATMSGYHSTGYHPAIKELIDSNIPVVAFDQNIPNVSKVRGAHIQGALIAVEHLIRLGHERIAYLGGPLLSPDRELGFRNAHTLNGLNVDESIIKRGNPTHEFGNYAMLELLKSKEKFTGVFCANDMIALGAMQCLIDAGVRIPEDVAVVGYDDIQMAHLIKPALTTVQQPISEMSSEVVTLLLKLIDKPNLPPKNLMFDMKLIIRESCGKRLTSSIK